MKHGVEVSTPATRNNNSSASYCPCQTGLTKWVIEIRETTLQSNGCYHKYNQDMMKPKKKEYQFLLSQILGPGLCSFSEEASTCSL